MGVWIKFELMRGLWRGDWPDLRRCWRAEDSVTWHWKKTFEFPSGYFGDTFNWCCKIKKSWGQNKFFSKKTPKKLQRSLQFIKVEMNICSPITRKIYYFSSCQTMRTFFFKFYQRFEFSIHYKRTTMKTLWGFYCLFNKASDTLLKARGVWY